MTSPHLVSLPVDVLEPNLHGRSTADESGGVPGQFKGSPGMCKTKMLRRNHFVHLDFLFETVNSDCFEAVLLELPILKNSEIFFSEPGLCHWSSSKVLSIEESKKPASESQGRIMVCRASRALKFTDLKNLKIWETSAYKLQLQYDSAISTHGHHPRRLCILVPGDLLVFESYTHVQTYLSSIKQLCHENRNFLQNSAAPTYQGWLILVALQVLMGKPRPAWG